MCSKIIVFMLNVGRNIFFPSTSHFFLFGSIDACEIQDIFFYYPPNLIDFVGFKPRLKIKSLERNKSTFDLK